jgi:hypothetical protein
VIKPPVKHSLKLSKSLRILFTKYPDDMFAQKSKDSLATFAKSLENTPDMDLKDCNLQIPAPGKQNVNLSLADIQLSIPLCFV